MSTVDRIAAPPAADVNLAAWFSGRARTTPERPAVTFEGVTRTHVKAILRTLRVRTRTQAVARCTTPPH